MILGYLRSIRIMQKIKGEIKDKMRYQLADRVGFEPTVCSHIRRFSRPVP